MLLLPLTLLITPLLLSLGAALAVFLSPVVARPHQPSEVPVLRRPVEDCFCSEVLARSCVRGVQHLQMLLGSWDNPGGGGLLEVSTSASCSGQGQVWGRTVLPVKVLESRQM